MESWLGDFLALVALPRLAWAAVSAAWAAAGQAGPCTAAIVGALPVCRRSGAWLLSRLSTPTSAGTVLRLSNRLPLPD